MFLIYHYFEIFTLKFQVGSTHTTLKLRLSHKAWHSSKLLVLVQRFNKNSLSQFCNTNTAVWRYSFEWQSGLPSYENNMSISCQNLANCHNFPQIFIMNDAFPDTKCKFTATTARTVTYTVGRAGYMLYRYNCQKFVLKSNGLLLMLKSSVRLLPLIFHISHDQD